MVALPSLPNKKAIEVAKDVLKRLKSKRLSLRGGVYLARKLGFPLLNFDELQNDLQAYVDEVESGCHVCMKGALLLSKARLFNAVPTTQVKHIFSLPPAMSSSRIKDLLKDTFDEESLDLLEIAFERYKLYWCTGSETHKDSALAFGKRSRTREGLVRRAMENVIQNKGYFKPWIKAKVKVKSTTKKNTPKLRKEESNGNHI